MGGQVIFNVPEGELTGFELELVGLINENVSWYANATFTDSEYTQDATLFNAGVGSTITASTNGKDFAGAPPLVVAAGLDYQFGDFTITPSARYVSGIWYDPENRIGSGGVNDDGYTVVNLNMQYRPGGGNWKIGVYAKNLFDEEFYKSGLTANGFLLAGVPGDPRQAGAYVTIDF